MTNDPESVILMFRDDTTALDRKKHAQFDRKGMINNKFNAFIMTKLEEARIPTHFMKVLSEQECFLDKDIYRKDGINPVESYERVGTLLGINFD